METFNKQYAGNKDKSHCLLASAQKTKSEMRKEDVVCQCVCKPARYNMKGGGRGRGGEDDGDDNCCCRCCVQYVLSVCCNDG